MSRVTSYPGASLYSMRPWKDGECVRIHQKHAAGGLGMSAMSATAADRAYLRKRMETLDERYRDAIVDLAWGMVLSPPPPEKTAWFKRHFPRQRGDKR